MTSGKDRAKRIGSKLGRMVHKNLSKARPNDIRQYLSSGNIAGIGRKTAKKIVAKFGNKAIEVVDRNPEALLQVRGIGKKVLAKIKLSWKKGELGCSRFDFICMRHQQLS